MDIFLHTHLFVHSQPMFKDHVYILLLGREVIGVFSSFPNALKNRSTDANKKKKRPSDYTIAKYILDIPGEESMFPA